ncbi:hypothetical protein HMPREF9336_02651 [Segniliparus rugosus ATCC BAA-974]|uniref:Glutaredoxin domain-containing protein n=2 Tax=Segniliparus rugosus TaxID=286804 RepID=E5XT29_SEGRC|nr:glutaredoxin family protein [Segniliparus rugosus]EFV12500.2 hypothetical protein HMPREF9336_02651 [Segniliparus rugosus ATCC BAA-974]
MIQLKADETRPEGIVAVTVYTRPACVQCGATLRLLNAYGVPVVLVDVSEDEAAADRLRRLGHMSLPVVVAGARSWSGFRDDLIRELAKEAAA